VVVVAQIGQKVQVMLVDQVEVQEVILVLLFLVVQLNNRANQVNQEHKVMEVQEVQEVLVQEEILAVEAAVELLQQENQQLNIGQDHLVEEVPVAKEDNQVFQDHKFITPAEEEAAEVVVMHHKVLLREAKVAEVTEVQDQEELTTIQEQLIQAEVEVAGTMPAAQMVVQVLLLYQLN
jgi:hypothetical protein